MSTKKSTAGGSNACPKCGSDAGGAGFCPGCGAKVRGASTDEKRARLEGRGGGRPGWLPAAAVVAAVALGGAGYALLGRGGDTRRAESVGAAATAAPGTASGITLPVSTFADGTARYYRWKAPSGTEVRFFVLRSRDGVVRAAFDACDVCYPAKKGYQQEGDFMVCRNCGQRFESVMVNEARGGCNPSPLDRTIEGGTLAITAAALQAGEKYF